MTNYVEIKIDDLGKFRGRTIGEACNKLDLFLKKKFKKNIRKFMQEERKIQVKVKKQKYKDYDWTVKRINRRR